VAQRRAARLPTEVPALQRNQISGSTLEGDTMKNGLYEATFTTNTGKLGTAAVLINNGSFVGADSMQFYRGHIDRTAEEMRVIMEVTRHDFSMESAFGNAALFTLTWAGKSLSDSTFKLACQPEDIDLTIYVTGKMLASID
jgi:hypothetical protein